jgi:hypothetical protein
VCDRRSARPLLHSFSSRRPPPSSTSSFRVGLLPPRRLPSVSVASSLASSSLASSAPSGPARRPWLRQHHLHPIPVPPPKTSSKPPMMTPPKPQTRTRPWVPPPPLVLIHRPHHPSSATVSSPPSPSLLRHISSESELTSAKSPTIRAGRGCTICRSRDESRGRFSYLFPLFVVSFRGIKVVRSRTAGEVETNGFFKEKPEPYFFSNFT